MHVRSYARAFPSDRRIYRVDRWAIPIPGGLPLAATVWFLALALTVGSIGQAPIVNTVIGIVGWPAAVIVAPGAGAVALTRRCDDGRTLPRLTLDRFAFVRRASCVSQPAARRLVRRLHVAADTSLPGRTIVHGPGRLRLRSTIRARVVRSRIRLEATGEPSHAGTTLVALRDGESIEVRA